jgi:outer membrane protein assembly factor BamA
MKHKQAIHRIPKILRRKKQRTGRWFLKCMLLLMLAQPLLQSCNTTRYLDRDKGQMYLVENKVKFKGKAKGKSNLGYELLQNTKQQPNNKFFGVPRPFFYYSAKDTVDMSKIGKVWKRFLGKNLGEAPVYLDTILTQEAARSMTYYLQNRGYFFAEVEEKISANRRKTKASVTYLVNTGSQFTVDTIKFLSQDTAIQAKLNEIAENTFFQKGSPIDIKLYDQEVSRITRYFRNNGYAYFYPQYISNLEATDSSNIDHSAVLELKVLLPSGKKKHQSYIVGNVSVNPAFDPSSLTNLKADTLIGKYFFTSTEKSFKVKPRTLINSISIATGELFDQSKVDNTIRQLGALGVFRPPTVRFEENPDQPGVVDFEVLLTPNKKWEFGTDFDISNTAGNSVGVANNLIGLSLNPSLRNRNFLRGAELLVTNVDFGLELAPFGDGTVVNSLDFRLQGDIFFPRFVDYFGMWRGMRKSKLVGKGFYRKLKQEGNSRFSSSYNLLNLLGNYTLHFVNLSYGYDLQLDKTDRVSINHFGIDLLVPNIKPNSRFDSLLMDNPFLSNSFSNQFITGLLFRDLTYTYSNGSSNNKSFWFLRSYLDISGAEVMAANAVTNGITGNSGRYRIGGADFSQYVKLELDGRHYFYLGPNRSLVARINGGVVQPYYGSEIPYVKQFYVGGPTSIRGWYARELGPGIYRDPNPPDSRNLFYQAGDMKLEFNLEYRFFLSRPLGFFDLHSAIFLDGGNIWTIGKDANRPGSEFTLSRTVNEDTGEIESDLFLRSMALSTGIGFRMDFTYFIFRFDLGTPLRNNYPDPERNNSYWFDRSDWKISNIYQFKNTVLNIGLGYPF